MARLVVLPMHGMGRIKPKYAAELESKLSDRLGGLWNEVSFQPVQYAHVFQQPETELWESMMNAPENRLSWHGLREFFLFSFADAACLERSAHKDPAVYQGVQAEIQKSLTAGFNACGGQADTPVVAVAHSLGGQVLSSYLWDAQKDQHIFENPPPFNPNLAKFLKLESLMQLVTTGCNIPIFQAGLKVRQCFEKPNPHFLWDNFYDPDDVLGWPLHQLDLAGHSYDMVQDHPINVGNILTSWNPISHVEYWGDRDVLKPLEERIRNLLS